MKTMKCAYCCQTKSDVVVLTLAGGPTPLCEECQALRRLALDMAEDEGREDILDLLDEENVVCPQCQGIGVFQADDVGGSLCRCPCGAYK